VDTSTGIFTQVHGSCPKVDIDYTEDTFYPFYVLFGCQKSSLIEFEDSLREIRPLLDEPKDFEKIIAENLKIDQAWM
jgi:hypothetical protein